MSDLCLHVILRKTAKQLSLKRYFPASQCINGHTSERHTVNGMCISCEKEKRESHSAIEYKNRYYQDNKEKILAANKARRKEKGPEYKLNMDRAWREKNKDVLAPKRRAYRMANEKMLRVAIRAWEAANPEKMKACRNNTRARRALAEGSHTGDDVKRIYESQRGICINCKIKIPKSGKHRYHIDHIVPLAKGGTNNADNLQILCRSCNCSKGAKDPIDWAQQNGRLL